MTTSSKEFSQLGSQDVGLIFVREYYTFLNKKPHRLHAFYNKDSCFVRGDEGTLNTMTMGQEEIRKKIEECQFQDCKVLITQVDSQPSANNGILIQVLGEMCNNNGPSQKFSQTFFLATQASGYYVLNDIFRFLKDEVDIDYYTYNQADAATAAPAITKEESNKQVPDIEDPPVEPRKLQPDSAKKEPIVNDTVEEVVKNEDAYNSDEVGKTEEVLEEEETPIKKEEEETSAAATAAATATAAVVVEPITTTEAPSQDQKKKVQTVKQRKSTPTASPTTPTKPKTWANLTAASPSNTSDVPSPSTTPTPIDLANSPPPVETSVPSTDVSTEKPQNKPRKEATQIYVKSVTESVTEEQLLEVFIKCGPVKSCNISRSRNCAFVEFTTVEGCQEALAQHKIQLSSGHTILAEERRFSSNNTNRYRNQSFEQRRSNNTNVRNRQQQQRQQQQTKGRTTPSQQKK